MAGPRRRSSRIAAAAAVVLTAGALGAGGVLLITDDDGPAAGGPTATQTTTAPTAAATAGGTGGNLIAATQTDFSALYAQRQAGVVSILAASEGQDRLGRSGNSLSQGSGVVIDDRGHILTNEHVVSGAGTVRVRFSNGETTAATVVGTDPSTDLALLRVSLPKTKLTVVPLASSAALKIGEPVLAIGSPFGFQGTATAGIVSGLGRSITSPNGFSVPDAIQIDAAVNHGNSGGALLNARGELVGVPTQIADSGVNAFVGVAFAVPSDTATRVIEQLLTQGEVDHAWLGVSTASVDETLEGVPGIAAERGALITGLAVGGPAEQAGLNLGDTRAEGLAGPVCVGGDVVTAVNGDAIADARALQVAVDARAPGETVTFTVVDGRGESREVAVRLGERPAASPETRAGCQG